MPPETEKGRAALVPFYAYIIRTYYVLWRRDCSSLALKRLKWVTSLKPCLSIVLIGHHVGSEIIVSAIDYSDTSANEDNSFRNHIRFPKRDFPVGFYRK